MPKFGGADCDGSGIDVMFCNDRNCPIDGQWSSWSPWSTCSKSCGIGYKQRKRICNNPVPSNGGSSCFGENVEIETCKADQRMCYIGTSEPLRQSKTLKKMTPYMSFDIMSMESRSTEEEDLSTEQVNSNQYYAERPPIEYVMSPYNKTITITLENKKALSKELIEVSL